MRNNFLEFEKKQNIALFNLIFVILVLFSSSIFLLINSKNYFSSDENKEDNLKKHIPIKYHENIQDMTKNNYDDFGPFDKQLNEEDSFLISDNLKNILIKFNKESFFDKEKIIEIQSILKNSKYLKNENFSELKTYASFNKDKNFIELRIKIDDFKFLRITKNQNNEFELKKIFFNNNSSESNIINLPSTTNSPSNEKNHNELIEFIGLNSSEALNKKFVLFEEKISNPSQLKNLLSNLNLNRENLNNLLNLISSSNKNENLRKKYKNSSEAKISLKETNQNPSISFKGLLILKDENLTNTFNNIKISYNSNSYSRSGKKELIYFSLNNKSYYLFKKNNISYYYDSNGNSLHSKKMFSMPLSGCYRISSNFGMRYHPVLHYTRMHNGVDLAIRHGHPVHAPANGCVEFAGRKNGYGNYLIINHGNGYKTGYAHLSKFDKKIRPGKFVSKNQLIAYVGNTGTSSGPHLHYEIIKNNRFIDPLKNNPSICERLEKNDLKKLKRMIELINFQMKEQALIQKEEEIFSNKKFNKV